MMRNSAPASAVFDVTADGRAIVRGALTFRTVSLLLEAGTGFIAGGSPKRIDLREVDAADSAGLALLVEWLSLSSVSGGSLLYENMPAIVLQLARLSEVESLLIGNLTPEVQAVQGVVGSGSASGSSGG